MVVDIRNSRLDFPTFAIDLMNGRDAEIMVIQKCTRNYHHLKIVDYSAFIIIIIDERFSSLDLLIKDKIVNRTIHIFFLPNSSNEIL